MNSVIELCIENLTRLDKPYKVRQAQPLNFLKQLFSTLQQPLLCKNQELDYSRLQAVTGIIKPMDLVQSDGRIKQCTVLSLYSV